jgi:5-methylcytosine-specific restriction endonuclease McrA
MIKCEICERNLITLAGLARHVYKSHNITVAEYYLKYINSSQGICKTCGKPTKFIGISEGFRKYCCIKCMTLNEDIQLQKRLTCRKTYGCDNPSQNADIKIRKLENSLENHGCEYPMQNKEIAEKVSISSKLKFNELQEKYPDLVRIENLIEGPNGEILGHCKNSNCPNSEENREYFEVTYTQLYNRNVGINSTSDTGYFYCCEECKKSCIVYRKSASQLDNLISPKKSLNKASTQDLSIWRSEVFTRQLKDNPAHKVNFCEICHKTENLVGHHILPQKLYPEFALDPDNGMILCSECHNKYGHEIGTECSTGNLANKKCK